MNIIRKTPNASGAYPAPQTWHKETPPDCYAVITDGVDMADFYAYNGFVTLNIEAVEHTRQVEKLVTVEKTREVEETTINENGEEVTTIRTETYLEDEVQKVDEVYPIDTMTAYTPNVEAWEAWKASLPEPEPEQPTEEEDTSAMLIDHEYRLTLLELGLSEY